MLLKTAWSKLSKKQGGGQRGLLPAERDDDNENVEAEVGDQRGALQEEKAEADDDDDDDRRESEEGSVGDQQRPLQQEQKEQVGLSFRTTITYRRSVFATLNSVRVSVATIGTCFIFRRVLFGRVPFFLQRVNFFSPCILPKY